MKWLEVKNITMAEILFSELYSVYRPWQNTRCAIFHSLSQPSDMPKPRDISARLPIAHEDVLTPTDAIFVILRGVMRAKYLAHCSIERLCIWTIFGSHNITNIFVLPDSLVPCPTPAHIFFTLFFFLLHQGPSFQIDTVLFQIQYWTDGECYRSSFCVGRQF